MRLKKTVLLLSLAAVFMFFFGYALVPIYNVMCQALGINGKTSNMQAPLSSTIDYSRSIEIIFVTTTNANLPWEFKALTNKIDIHPGENKEVDFFAKNLSNQTMTVQAIPSVTPGLAAKHLKKTECFCFTSQTLPAQQSMKMPVLFHLDMEFPKDINTITLSYTLFQAIKGRNVSDKLQKRISN